MSKKILGAARRFVDSFGGDSVVRLHMSDSADLRPDYESMHRHGEASPAEIRRMWSAIGKPVGLWYDVNAAWMEWCLTESPHWVRPYVYEVVLDESKIMKVGDVAAFDAFEGQYVEIPEEYRWLPQHLSYGVKRSSLYGRIDWVRVAGVCGGVEISPYLWERRLESPWYYGWDCASGCVWDASAVREVRLYAAYDGRDDYTRVR